MKFKLLLFAILLITSNLNLALGNITSDSLLESRKSRPKQASLLLLSIGYKMPINKNNIISSGHGTYIEGGINSGRLVSKNLVVGLYAGWAFMDKLWTTSFDENFSNDYNTSIKKENSLSELDSAIINSSTHLFKNTTGNSDIVPGCEMRSFHNYALYYGILIKLPYKYIPALKIYKGTIRTHYRGIGNIVTKNTDYNIFELRRDMLGCELMILNTEQLFHLRKLKQKSHHRGGGLSIYYETYNFYNSSLYFYDGTTTSDISLQKFTSISFLQKYKNDVSYGFKLCFYIM